MKIFNDVMVFLFKRKILFKYDCLHLNNTQTTYYFTIYTFVYKRSMCCIHPMGAHKSDPIISLRANNNQKPRIYIKYVYIYMYIG